MLNDLKAEFSHTYVRAIAHAAGYFVQEPNRMMDGDGVDLTIFARGAGGVVRSQRLDVQLKATQATVESDPFPFDLDVKNYDELRAEDFQVPRILVVVVVPNEREAWVTPSEQELILRHSGYWLALRGAPATTNGTSIRVKLPRSACFHVTQLQSMMSQIREGALP